MSYFATCREEGLTGGDEKRKIKIVQSHVLRIQKVQALTQKELERDELQRAEKLAIDPKWWGGEGDKGKDPCSFSSGGFKKISKALAACLEED